ncbi:protein MNN4 isoform X1 [Sesamum indicum]|uniref:Protein MNN4 isoform X1 n=1 Tax=Sesamum indicum TaxID=4182 RepID=A0A6I9U7L0_SESIN|nr:protein MNN4 isoform X1 [Sesamum indicum]
MAKKQVPAERTRKKNNSKIHIKSKSKNKSRNFTTQNKSRNKIRKTANDDASSEETEVLVVPSSSTESQNDEVVGSSEEAEEDDVSERSPSDEDEKEEKKKPKSIKKKGKRKDVKNKGKRRSRKAAEEEEKRENALYRFPMNRVSRIIKSENSDLRISQEAVFLINRASEKFLQLFCREAYACTFLDRKNYTAYNHLSSVVSKRKRFDFLSDFIPEKLKAEDALAENPEAEK